MAPGGAASHLGLAVLAHAGRAFQGEASHPRRCFLTSAVARLGAELQRLADSPLPRVLFVSHGFGGGIARHLDDLEVLLHGHAHVLRLKPDRPSYVTLQWERGTSALWFHGNDDWRGLTNVLKAVGVDRVHFHHVDGLPREVLELPDTLACGHDVTLHDYFPVCANYHLADGEGRFCGGDPGCGRCADAAPAAWGLTVEGWRALFEPLLAKARRVIAPSGDAARRTRAFYPAVAPVVWPHPEPSAAPLQRPVRVLVPGAISPAKGLDLVDACIEDAARRGLPLHFRVLGFTARPLRSWPERPFTLTGQYPEQRLPSLFAQERGDVVLFPVQCAETFSYTLSDAMDTGLPIVATDLGALPERLAHYRLARIVDASATPADLNEVLLTCASPSTPSAIERPRESPAAYRARYMEGLAPRPRGAPAPFPVLEEQWSTQRGEDTQRMWTLAGLFEDAVLCGRASSAQLLRGRAAEADADAARLRESLAILARHDAERARLDAQAAEERARAAAEHASLREHLDAARRETAAEREHASRRIEAVEAELRRTHASRSWRLTAPLRALKRLFTR